MRKNIILFVAFSIPILALSQSNIDRAIISSSSDRIANERLINRLIKSEYNRKERLKGLKLSNKYFNTIVKNDEFGKIEIIDVLPDGNLVIAKTDNAGAATTARATSLYNGGSLGVNIQGQGMTAAVWDGGSVRNTHQEFMVNSVSKVTIMDGGTMSAHGTHVAGTIAAQGVNSSVRGLAFNASVKSYDWTSDLSEMTYEASEGLLTSNHSYAIGILGSIWFFGAYDSRARDIDEICYNNPYYLPVMSAGNSRNDTTSPASTQIANKSGYDLIFGHGNAKNVMTVAAVNNVSSYVDEYSVVMSSFSSWGPSDDGRIKPDISMKGVNVLSTLSTSDTFTGTMSGTSMAAPGVTGVVTLLQQYYRSLFPSYMKSATAKGIILHTADEAGAYLGPDYQFGWGLINAQKAAQAMKDKSTSANKCIIEENALANGSTYTKTISASGSNPLKVSISWTDPASATINSGTVDPTASYLINDLDLRLVGPNGTIYYPWKLQGMSSPDAAATREGTNNADNFELVEVDVPSGTYTIQVTHKGSLTGGSQNFSLIATANSLTSVLNTQEIQEGQKVTIYPNPAKDVLHISNVEKNSTAKIFDSSGKLIKNFQIADGKINIADLPIGDYLIKIEQKNKNIITDKFIKK